jgi:OPA family glycerol-3-phosphate transporter-like MFS transporter
MSSVGVGINTGVEIGSSSAAVSTKAGVSVNSEPRSGKVLHTKKFRRRRSMNWLILGLTYSAMYTGRYNLALANQLLSKTFGWDKTQIGGIISPALLAYGLFAMFNGPIADKIGGRKAMLIGTVGSACFNFLFGLGAYFGFLGTGTYLIGYFATVWMMNSYFQSFGAVSLIKVNAAWFHISERGVFSAIFGSMIQMGRTLVFMVGPTLILLFSWQWLFFIPSLLVTFMALLTYFTVRNNPEDCGLPRLDVQDASSGDTEKVSLRFVLRKIFTNPVTISIAAAEFCTGFVRQGFEQWFPRYMVEVQKLPLESAVFKRNALAVVVAGILGAVLAGTLSDWVFKGRRIPVAFIGYLAQVICLAVVWRAPSLDWVVGAFVVNSCAISMVQSMLSGTASMDFGGKNAAATAAGFFDGMQYIGGSFVGLGMGWMLDRFGWGTWGPSMIGFSVIGMLLMLAFWNARPKTSVTASS